jgi:hypothetical protein
MHFARGARRPARVAARWSLGAIFLRRSIYGIIKESELTKYLYIKQYLKYVRKFPYRVLKIPLASHTKWVMMGP